MGSPFDQLQQITVNLSGRDIGVDKYKPYTFGNERVNASVTVAGQIFPAVVDSGNLYINFSSGEIKRGLGDEGNFDTTFSGNQEGIPFNIMTGGIHITGLVDGYPSDDAVFRVTTTGQQSASNIDIAVLGADFDGRWSGILIEKIDGYAADLRSGALIRNDRDEATFDFLLTTGTVTSGDYTPPIDPANYPHSGEDQYSFDFTFVTGTYQGS
jgi:hypothetical protein